MNKIMEGAKTKMEKVREKMNKPNVRKEMKRQIEENQIKVAAITAEQAAEIAEYGKEALTLDMIKAEREANAILLDNMRAKAEVRERNGKLIILALVAGSLIIINIKNSKDTKEYLENLMKLENSDFVPPKVPTNEANRIKKDLQKESSNWLMKLFSLKIS